MALTLQDFLPLVGLTVQQPKKGARQLIALRLTRTEAWGLVSLMAVTSTLLAELALRLSGIPVDPMVAAVFNSPLRLAALQFLVMGCAAFAIVRVGNWAGGSGTLTDGLVLIGWLQAVLLVLQCAELLAAFVFPVLAGLISLAAPFLSGWLLTNFTAELHGFQSLAKVFFGLLVGFLAFSVVLAGLAVAFLDLGA